MNVEVKAPIYHVFPVFVDDHRIGSVRYKNGNWLVLGWGWTPTKLAYQSKEQAVNSLVNEWPGVSALKVDRSGSDAPLSGTNVTEPGPSFIDRGGISSPRLYHE